MARCTITNTRQRHGGATSSSVRWCDAGGEGETEERCRSLRHHHQAAALMLIDHDIMCRCELGGRLGVDAGVVHEESRVEDVLKG
ncbi:unnamed protein product [Leuciscus chuanchicus]